MVRQKPLRIHQMLPKELLDFSHRACPVRHFYRTREQEDMHRKSREQRGKERRNALHTERTRSSLNSKTMVQATWFYGGQDVQKGKSYSKKVTLSYLKCQRKETYLHLNMVIGLLKGKKKDPGEIIVHGSPRLGTECPSAHEDLAAPFPEGARDGTPHLVLSPALPCRL